MSLFLAQNIMSLPLRDGVVSFFVEQSVYGLNVFAFLVITVALGGGAAYMAGRALAKGWKSPALLFFYMLLFTAGLRFLHFALYEGDLISLRYYFSHGLVVMAAAFLGYRRTRAVQMVTQYPWLYEPSGLLSWKQKL